MSLATFDGVSSSPRRGTAGAAPSAILQRSALPIRLLICACFWAFCTLADSYSMNTIAAVLTLGALLSWVVRLPTNLLLMVSFLQIGAFFLTGFLCFGWVGSAAITYFQFDSSIGALLSARDIDAADYALAIFFCVLFSFAFSAAAFLPHIRRLERAVLARLLELRDMSQATLNIYIIVLTATGIIMLATGLIGTRSLAIEGREEGIIQWYSVFIEPVFAIQIALNALCVSRMRLKFDPNMLVGGLSLAVILIIFISKGRSSFFYCIIAHAYWFILFYGRLPKLRYIVITGVILVPLIANAFLISNFARSAAFADQVDDTRGAAIEVLLKAYQSLESEDQFQANEAQSTLSNLSSRSLVASSFAISLKPTDQGWDFLMGKYLLHSAIWTIPRVIFPEKENYSNQEGLLAEEGIRSDSTDTADSIYYASYVDFGWMGLIIYPAIIVLFWSLALRICLWRGDFVLLAILGMWLQMFILKVGEGSVTGWIVLFRNSYLIGAAAVLLAVLIYGLKERRRRRTMRVPS